MTERLMTGRRERAPGRPSPPAGPREGARRILRAALAGLSLAGLAPVPGIAAPAEAQPPGSAEILRADAYVAEYSTALGGRAVLRRGGQRATEIEPGQLLFGGDTVEIEDGRPRVSIKAPGRPRPIYLPEDGRAFRVAPRPELSLLPAGPPALPGWVVGLFERKRLTQPRDTMARDSRSPSDPGTGADAAGCPSPAPGSVLRPVAQILAADRTRVTVIWQQMPVARVDLRGRTGPALSSRAVAGRSAALDIASADRGRLDRIALYREDGGLLMEIPVRFGDRPAGPAAAPGPHLAEALGEHGTRCARRDARTLEAMSRVADLRERSLAASVIFEAMADGEMRW